jgi:hypothetical protein
MIDNKSFDSLEHFKYLRPTISNQNSIQEGIRSSFNSGNGCYFWAENLLCSSSLIKNKIRLFKTISFLAVMNGCETWSLTLREERRMKLFANRILRESLDLRGARKQASGEEYSAEFNDLSSSPNIIRVITSKIIRWVGHVALVRERRGLCRVLVMNPEENRPLGRPRLRQQGTM